MKNRALGLLSLSAALVVACGRGVIDPAGTGGGEASSTGGGTAGTGGGSAELDAGNGGDGGVGGDLPCEVASVLSESCVSCHNGYGGVVRLTTAADLAAASVADPSKTFAQRAVLRMRATVGAMPPAPAAPVASSRVKAFEAWVNAGQPAGSCRTTLDAGTDPVDAGPIIPHDGGIAGLPCEVSTFVAAKCASCHSNPATHGASFPLLSRADFLAPSPSYAGQSIGQRSSVRIHQSSNPMPPLGTPAPTAAEITAFDTWVTQNMPVGNCGSIDAGTPDAGPAPTTCASNSRWTRGNSESPDMNPGMACLTCHLQRASDKAYTFSGTVFPSLHEQDRCNAKPPSQIKVEILDKNGAVAATMYASSASGNFNSRTNVRLTLPYTARLTMNGRTATMTTPQTNGDCNACHTEQGAQGAAGRIVWP